MKNARLIFCSIAIVAGIAQTTRAESAPLTVCEVLSLGSDRHEVTVRGEVVGSHHHGFALSAGLNGDPCPGWRRNLFTAPSIIPFGSNPDFGVHLTDQQKESDREFFLRLRQLSLEGRLNNPTVTVTGVVVRKTWSLIFRRADGSYFGTGIDPQGASPLYLVITSIRDRP